MKIRFLSLLSVGMFIISCNSAPTIPGSFDVIPKPREVSVEDGSRPFVFPATVKVYAADALRSDAEILSEELSRIAGIDSRIVKEGSGKGIHLSVDSNAASNEGYSIKVDNKGIYIAGADCDGLFYGIQTLCKAMPIGEGRPSLPAGTIKDYPRFGYRGFLLDVGRSFFGVDYIKKLIDQLALHNINYFHWHLTEDQGWRFQSAKYPLLTEVGSYRPESKKEPWSDEYDGTPMQGFYTREQMKEVVEYAAERHITVIPEIEVPGHSLAVLKAYPELGCTHGPYEIPTRFGVFEDILCGGKPESLEFVKDILEEVMDIFPSEYIHIGGDEAPKARWRECPVCQAKIKELGLKDEPGHSKEDQLQTWMMGEVQKLIESRGRKMMGWDEILDGRPAASATVMAWTSPEATVRSVKGGHATVVTPIQYLYLSNPWIARRYTGLSNIRRVYDFNPIPDGLSPAEESRIIGVQTCMWTEWTRDPASLEWKVFPRIAAGSELGWSAPEAHDFGDFVSRLDHMTELYRVSGIAYRDYKSEKEPDLP